MLFSLSVLIVLKRETTSKLTILQMERRDGIDSKEGWGKHTMYV